MTGPRLDVARAEIALRERRFMGDVITVHAMPPKVLWALLDSLGRAERVLSWDEIARLVNRYAVDIDPAIIDRLRREPWPPEPQRRFRVIDGGRARGAE